jgi:hypothetical protein
VVRHPEEPPISIWSHKPWWCQPWTILLTGVIAGAGSWFLLRLAWVTTLVSMGVLLWWLVFLVLVPAAYRQQQDSSQDN